MSSCVTRVCGRTIIMWDDSCLQENLIHSLEKELMKREHYSFYLTLKKGPGKNKSHYSDFSAPGFILHRSYSSFFYNVSSWCSISHTVLTEETMGSKKCLPTHLFCQYHEWQAVSQLFFFFKGMKLKSMSIFVDGCVHVGTGKGSSLQMSYLENNVWCLWWYILVCMYYYQVIRQRLRNGNPSVRPGSQPKGMMNKERVMVPFLKFHFSRNIV